MKLSGTGSFELYRRFRYSAKEPVPLNFISASPHFYRRTLCALFEIHEINYTGLYLKNVLTILDTIIRKGIHSLANLPSIISDGTGTILDRGKNFFSSTVDSFFDHTSHKLGILLENRLMQPSGTREILIGDNTENDFFIFALYRLLLRGVLVEENLEEYLCNLEFRGRKSMVRDVSSQLTLLAKRCTERHGPLDSVVGVWINQAIETPGEQEMIRLIGEALPEGLKRDEDVLSVISDLRACRGAEDFEKAALEIGLLTSGKLERKP